MGVSKEDFFQIVLNVMKKTKRLIEVEEKAGSFGMIGSQCLDLSYPTGMVDELYNLLNALNRVSHNEEILEDLERLNFLGEFQ